MKKDNIIFCNTVTTVIILLLILVLLLLTISEVCVANYKAAQTQAEINQKLDEIRYWEYKEILREVQ